MKVIVSDNGMVYAQYEEGEDNPNKVISKPSKKVTPEVTQEVTPEVTNNPTEGE